MKINVDHLYENLNEELEKADEKVKGILKELQNEGSEIYPDESHIIGLNVRLVGKIQRALALYEIKEWLDNCPKDNSDGLDEFIAEELKRCDEAIEKYDKQDPKDLNEYQERINGRIKCLYLGEARAYCKIAQWLEDQKEGELND